jgi:glycosyltransferase involved in cell wall biosynthesis
MGYLKNPLLRTALEIAEKRVTAQVDRVVTIGERMKQVFARKGVLPDRICVIPNWSIVKDRPDVARQSNPLLAAHGLVHRFVVQYAGNMGVVHDMEPIAEAMRQTAGDADIHWLFIGGGKRRAEIEDAVAANDLKNTTLLSYQPIDRLWTSLNAADVSLVSLRPNMEGLVVPSKLYGALDAGRPVVFIGAPDGEVARVLSRFDCGLQVSDGEGLAGALRQLKSDPGRLAAMGENARNAYAAHFSRQHAIEHFNTLIDELTS